GTIALNAGLDCRVPQHVQDTSQSRFAIAQQHWHDLQCAEALGPTRRVCRDWWRRTPQTFAAPGQRPQDFRRLCRLVPTNTTLRRNEDRDVRQFRVLVLRLGNDASQAEPGPWCNERGRSSGPASQLQKTPPKLLPG